MSFNLKNKVILITGATGHLGEAIARGLARAGAETILHGRNLQGLEQLAQEMKDNGHSVSTVSGDLTQAETISSILNTLSEKFGKLDGLVNNAYSGAVGTFQESTREQVEASLTSGLTSPYLLIQALLPLLKQAQSASVVNVSSMYGMLSPDPRIYGESGYNSPPYYGAAKAGLIQLTRYLGCHLAREGIRVNAISPGPFPPPTLRQTQADFLERLEEKVPMGRIGKAEEVTGAVQFLLSEASSYITGVNLPVDGGWTAGSN